MKRLLGCFTLVAGVLSYFGGSSFASSLEIVDLGKYFQGVATSSFVLFDEDKDKYIVFNEEQANLRLSPCSTFKIYNSLAGLETGVLDKDDQKTLQKWDGVNREFPGWNQDHTLSTAIQNSVVWYFQELASRIGEERMKEFLARIGYGNQDISGGLTSFWLTSSVKISAREQVDLLYRLFSGKLPVSADNVEIVKRDITLSDQNGVRLMGKTGSGKEDGKWVLGWFVGCVEKEGKRFFFAVNIQNPDGVNGPKAREIAKEILKDLSLL